VVKKLNLFAKKLKLQKKLPFGARARLKGLKEAQGLQTRTSVKTALHKTTSI
jgi:hypothetical protein